MVVRFVWCDPFACVRPFFTCVRPAPPGVFLPVHPRYSFTVLTGNSRPRGAVDSGLAAVLAAVPSEPDRAC